MSLERDHEAAAAARVLAELTGGAEETAPGLVEDEVAEVLRRLYLEGFGLLGYESEPIAARPELKARLLAAVAGDETQEVEPVLAPAAAPEPPLRRTEPAAEPAEAPAPPPTVPAPVRATPTPEPARPAAAAARRAPGRGPRRWVGVLALLFALATVGLGLFAAYLQSELDSARARLRRAEGERAEAASRSQQELAAVRAELAELERRHGFATAPGVNVLTLRPPVGSGQPGARATFWIAADRRRWQLEASGLAPAPADRDYQVWFVVDGIPRRAGVFAARAGRPAVVADDDLPAGTTSVWITLERKGGAPAPSTSVLLVAERPSQR